jgi:hypothetical protein
VLPSRQPACQAECPSIGLAAAVAPDETPVMAPLKPYGHGTVAYTLRKILYSHGRGSRPGGLRLYGCADDAVLLLPIEMGEKGRHVQA